MSIARTENPAKSWEMGNIQCFQRNHFLADLLKPPISLWVCGPGSEALGLRRLRQGMERSRPVRDTKPLLFPKMCQDHSAMKPGLCGAGGGTQRFTYLTHVPYQLSHSLSSTGDLWSLGFAQGPCVILYPFKDRSCYVIHHNRPQPQPPWITGQPFICTLTREPPASSRPKLLTQSNPLLGGSSLVALVISTADARTTHRNSAAKSCHC